MHRCDWLDGAEDTVVIVLEHYSTRLQSINDIAEEAIENDVSVSTVRYTFLSEPAFLHHHIDPTLLVYLLLGSSLGYYQQ
jgi:hypothetical protein